MRGKGRSGGKLGCILQGCKFCCLSSTSLFNPSLHYHNLYATSIDASLACSHTKPSSVRTSPPSLLRATPLVDPSHASVYPHHPTLIMQHPYKEHSWNALDDCGDVIRAAVEEYFATRERGPYLEVVAALPLYPNFMVIIYHRYR